MITLPGGLPLKRMAPAALMLVLAVEHAVGGNGDATLGYALAALYAAIAASLAQDLDRARSPMGPAGGGGGNW